VCTPTHNSFTLFYFIFYIHSSVVWAHKYRRKNIPLKYYFCACFIPFIHSTRCFFCSYVFGFLFSFLLSFLFIEISHSEKWKSFFFFLQLSRARHTLTYWLTLACTDTYTHVLVLDEASGLRSSGDWEAEWKNNENF
jgi:hypothetical protein